MKKLAIEKQFVIAFVIARMVFGWETINCPYEYLDN